MSTHTASTPPIAESPVRSASCSPLQLRIIETIQTKALNGSMSTSELAIRCKTSRLAISSAMRSLKARSLAADFRHGDDQWAAQMWCLTDAVNAELSDGSK